VVVIAMGIVNEEEVKKQVVQHFLDLHSVRSVTQVAMYFSMPVTNIPFPNDLGFAPDRKLSTPPKGGAFRLLLPLGPDDSVGMIIIGGPPGSPASGPAPCLRGGGAPGGQPGGGGGCMPARGLRPAR
jgi:hypothetical protein